MARSKALGCCTRPQLGWAAIVLLLAGEVAQGQLSKPVAHDSHWHKQDNKFLNRKAENDKEGEEQKYDDLVGDNICPIDVELKWMTEVSSSVYATPLITDLYADGRKDIIVPGFVHYTEVLEGPDGAKALGWPAFHKSTVHASPLLYDIDSDGIRDILVATYDGEIVFFKDNGEMLNHRLIVPRLRVRKKWFVGVNPDPVDHSHPDVGAGTAENNPYEKAVHGVRTGGKQGVAAGSKSPPAAATAVTTGQPAQQQAQPVQQQQQQVPQQAQPAQQQAQPAQQQAQPVQQQAQPVQQQQQQQVQQQAQPAVQQAQPTQQQAQPAVQQQQQPAAATPAQVPAVATPTQAAVPAQGGAVQQQQQQPQAQQQQPVQQQQQQPAAAAATGQQGAAHTGRRLMSVDSDDAEELTTPQRHLLQAGSAAGGAAAVPAAAGAAVGAVPAAAGGGDAAGAAGNPPAAGGAAAGSVPAAGAATTGRGSVPAAAAAAGSNVPAGGAAAGNAAAAGGAAAGNAAAAAGAAGVESDPSHNPLTAEALESFKIFEDEPPAAAAADSAGNAAAAGGQPAQQQQQQEPEKPYGSIQEPEDVQEGLAAAADDDAAVGEAVDGEGTADAAADDGDAAAGEAEQGEMYPYTYPTEAYDEFGDKLDQVAGLEGHQEGGAAAGGGEAAAGDAAGGAAAGQQQQQDQQQQLRDLGDATYNGGWNDDMWEDEMYRQAKHQLEEEWVYVDAHILCTPAIADIDNDQHDELVVAISYFYDKEYYDDPAHAHELQGTDKEKYVAGGIVVFDLRTRVIKWQQHLDLTTATTKFTAHMFSSPTLADIDADGQMEVVVGTSVGFVYVLNSRGDTRPGWPVQMGEVQGQVMVADLNADGAVEIFAGDALGNIALLDVNGKELWERHVKSMITQGGVAGDINGDGLLDIVFGTADGRVHAVRGTDGQPLQGFPFQTGGRIQAPATITQLTRNARHQHVLIMSFDGFLYLIDGQSACAHTVDIGEASYSAVLVDDLAGDDKLELLVATMNGNVYMLQTQQRYHPAKTWSSQVQGINGMVARWGYFGFVATSEGRQLRDVAGQHLQVQVELWDARTMLHNGLPMDDPPRGPYNITVMLKGVGVAEMNAGSQPVIGVSDVLDKPGKTIIEIPCPRTRTTAAVHLDVITKNGLHFEDEFVLSFHMHFHKLLKWLIALPLLAMASVAVIVAQSYGFDVGKSPDRIV